MVEIGSNHVGADQQDVRLLAVAVIKKRTTAGSLLGKAKCSRLLCGWGLAGQYFLAEKGPRGEATE